MKKIAIYLALLLTATMAPLLFPRVLNPLLGFKDFKYYVLKMNYDSIFGQKLNSNDNLTVFNDKPVNDIKKKCIDSPNLNQHFLVKKCTCINRKGKTTVYYAIIPKECKPELCIANDTNHTVELSTAAANRSHATICVNAGLFDINTSETRGYTIANGKVINKTAFSNKYTTDYLYMTEEGHLELFPISGTLEDLTKLKPQWAVLGFHPIVSDGKYVADLRDPNDYTPRTFIGQDYEGNYILGACSGRMLNQAGLSLSNIYSIIKAIGFDARILYNLDGGGSSVFVYNGVRLNELTRGEDRPCANFLIVRDS